MQVEEEYPDKEEYVSNFVFLKNDTRFDHIPLHVLFDSCSTVSVFKSKQYVTSIRKGSRILKTLTNGGQQVSTNIADTKYFGQVWFNEESLTNIFSLVDVCKYARVTKNSSVKNSMFVHREDGYVMEFK